MRFSLRTLFLFTTAVVAWLGYEAEQVHRQRQAVAAIEGWHGSLRYDDSLRDSTFRGWLAPWVGRDAVACVDAVYLGGASVGDADLAHLEKLPRLRTLVLTSSPITDAGLAHLRGLSNLETLDLRFTTVTDAGVADLRRALPR